jgi:hypothetical protein
MTTKHIYESGVFSAGSRRAPIAPQYRAAAPAAKAPSICYSFNENGIRGQNRSGRGKFFKEALSGPTNREKRTVAFSQLTLRLSMVFFARTEILCRVGGNRWMYVQATIGANAPCKRPDF